MPLYSRDYQGVELSTQLLGEVWYLYDAYCNILSRKRL